MSESWQFAHTLLKSATMMLVFLTLSGIAMPFMAEYLRKLVIHVNSACEMTQGMAVRNASTALSMLKSEVVIEFVTYGPGISLVTKGGAYETKVIGLMDKGVKFHLCDLTVKRPTKKSKAPSIIEGVSIVSSGTVKIMDLQEAGYSYLKP